MHSLVLLDVEHLDSVPRSQVATIAADRLWSYEAVTSAEVVGTGYPVSVVPDGLFILEIDRDLTSDQAQRLHDHLRAQLGDAKVLVVAGGLRMRVATDEERAAHRAESSSSNEPKGG